MFPIAISIPFELSLCDTHLSDHKEIILSLNKLNKNFNIKDVALKTHWVKINYREYNNELLSISNMNMNTFNNFGELILSPQNYAENHIYNSLRTDTPKYRKPWIDDDIIKLIRERKRYFSLLKTLDQ